MKNNKPLSFWADESGETNLVSIIIVIGVLLAAVLLFRSFIPDLFALVQGLFS